MIIIKFIKVAVIIATGTVCFVFGRDIPIAEQMPILETMRDTAAVVFGVMGIWLAILYPKSLQNLFLIKTDVIDAEIQNAKRLFPPIRYSTLIIGYVLGISFLEPMLKKIALLLEYTSMLRGISYALLGLLTIVQIWTLILSLAPNYLLEQVLKTFLSKTDQKKRILSQTQKIQ